MKKLALFVLILLNIFLLLKLNFNNAKLNSLQSQSGDHSCILLKELYFDAISNIQKKINDIEVINIFSNESISLSNILSNEESMIVRIDDSNCITCIEFIFSMISEHQHQHQHQIIVIASFSNRNGLIHLVKKYGLTNNVYTYNGLINISIYRDGFDFPYCFILNSELIGRAFYIPRKEFPELCKAYFNFFINNI